MCNKHQRLFENAWVGDFSKLTLRVWYEFSRCGFEKILKNAFWKQEGMTMFEIQADRRN